MRTLAIGDIHGCSTALRTRLDAVQPGAEDRLVTLGDYIAPESDVEIAVAELWAASLGITQIGLDDEFFVLGGSSLTAVQLASRTRERFGIELSVAELFEHSTVRRLAVIVDRRLDALLDQIVAPGATPGDHR